MAPLLDHFSFHQKTTAIDHAQHPVSGKVLRNARRAMAQETASEGACRELGRSGMRGNARSDARLSAPAWGKHKSAVHRGLREDAAMSNGELGLHTAPSEGG